MALPVSFWGQTLNDNTIKSNGEPENASYRVPVITLTAANLVAQQALHANLAAAVAGVTMGTVRHTTTLLDETIGTLNPAASTLAQRENKFLCRYHDVTTGQKYRVSLPTADLSTLPNNSEFLDLTTGPGAALKTAFEAVVRSPGNAANAVTLDTVQFVGRNS